MVGRVLSALDREHARLVLVTSPEAFSLNESLRAREQLHAAPVPLEISEIVLNRAVVDPANCRRCKARAKRTRAAERFLRQNFAGVPLRVGEDPGEPVLGPESLLAFARHIFEGKHLKFSHRKLARQRELELESSEWPALDVPLTLTLGKGGVGKTTISAGLAFNSRRHDPAAVTVCSIDPAPSLDDVFQAEVTGKPRSVLDDSKLQAAEIDAVAEYQRWANEMRAKIESATSTEVRGVHLDLTFERDLFLAVLDVVPPGVDELFAIFRILDLVDRGGRVQIDMAPTGHALEVLRTPARLLGWTRVLLKTLAHHRTLPLARDAAVEIATVSQRIRELAATLNDPHRSRAWVVMLAEPLPDRETRRLLADLRDMRVPVAGIFVNRVLMETGYCKRCQRARAWQKRMLDGLRDWDVPVLIVPEFNEEIAGKRGLERLTKTLWRLH
jgi:arsenite-transporting ATPase